MGYFNSSFSNASHSVNNAFALNEGLWASINETTSLRNDTTCIGLNEMQWEAYKQLSWWLEGVGTMIVGSLGIFFNTAAIYILLVKELVVIPFNNLVVSLAIVDNMFLLISAFYHIPTAFELEIRSTYLYQELLASFLYPAIHITMYCSTYMTVVLALDRYNSVSQPSKYNSATRTTHPTIYVLRYIIPVTLLSVVFNVPKYFDLEIKQQANIPEMNNSNMITPTISPTYTLAQTGLRKNQEYVFWYVNVANFAVTCFIPFTCLIYLNGNIYRRRKNFLQRQMQTRKSAATGGKVCDKLSTISVSSHTQQTIILHAIVVVCLVCHSLRIVLNIEEWVNMKDVQRGCYSFWTSMAQTVGHLLLQINSSANFFIYCVLNKTFNKVLMKKLHPLLKCRRQNVDDISTNANGMRLMATKYTRNDETITYT